MSNRRRTVLTLALVTLAVGAMASTGCSRKGRYRLKPTPGVFTTTQTNAQANNNWHYMVNHNIRALIDDFGRFTLIDRPSRMVPHPVTF